VAQVRSQALKNAVKLIGRQNAAQAAHVAHVAIAFDEHLP